MAEWRLQHLPEHWALLVTVQGIMKPEETYRMAAETLGEAQRLGVTRFLVDEREMKPEATTIEIYAMPDALHKIGLRPHHRLAIVYPESDEGSQEMRFFETVALNQGLQVHLCRTMTLALDWLEESPPHEGG